MAAPIFKGWDSTYEIRKLRDNRWAGDKKLYLNYENSKKILKQTI